MRDSSDLTSFIGVTMTEVGSPKSCLKVSLLYQILRLRQTTWEARRPFPSSSTLKCGVGFQTYCPMESSSSPVVHMTSFGAVTLGILYVVHFSLKTCLCTGVQTVFVHARRG